jgi:hypothetical protein
MSNAVHRRHAAVVLAAFVMAAAFPMTLVLSRDTGETTDEVSKTAVATKTTIVVTKVMAETQATTAVPLPAFSEDSDRSDAATQAASMMLVGSLLIGIGTVVRPVI